MKIKRSKLFGIVVMFILLGTEFALAGTDEAVLAQKSGCLACHHGAAKGNGPAYKDVATKYVGRNDAEDVLVEHIIKGTGPDGVGWMQAGQASLPFMPPNRMAPDDARRLARWILVTTGEIPDVGHLFTTKEITVSGLVRNSLTLNTVALSRFSPQQISVMPIISQGGAEKGQLKNFKGTRLTDILDKAGILTTHHNDVKKMVIVATASDGYKVVFSWSELFNSPIGEGVLVFYEKDGLPLGNEEGHIAMISTKDTRTGPRHVKWLQGVEVRKIAD